MKLHPIINSLLETDLYKFSIEAKDGFVQIAGKKLLADGKEIKTAKALNSEIG